MTLFVVVFLYFNITIFFVANKFETPNQKMNINRVSFHLRSPSIWNQLRFLRFLLPMQSSRTDLYYASLKLLLIAAPVEDLNSKQDGVFIPESISKGPTGHKESKTSKYEASWLACVRAEKTNVGSIWLARAPTAPPFHPGSSKRPAYTSSTCCRFQRRSIFDFWGQATERQLH